MKAGPRGSALASVTSVDVVDEYTIRLNITEWDSWLLTQLATGRGLMVSLTAVKANGAEWAKMNPVSTGPFKLVSFEPDTFIKTERFDDFDLCFFLFNHLSLLLCFALFKYSFPKLWV